MKTLFQYTQTQLNEGTFYSTPAEKDAFLKDKQSIAHAFIFNFFGIVGIMSLFSGKSNIMSYLTTDQKLRIDNIVDSNNDMSLSVKLFKDAGGLTDATANNITKFLVLVKNKSINSTNFNEEIIRGFASECKFAVVRPDTMMLDLMQRFIDKKINLKQVTKALYNDKALKKYAGISGDFRTLSLTIQSFIRAIPDPTPGGIAAPTIPTATQTTQPAATTQSVPDKKPDIKVAPPPVKAKVVDLDFWKLIWNCENKPAVNKLMKEYKVDNLDWSSFFGYYDANVGEFPLSIKQKFIINFIKNFGPSVSDARIAGFVGSQVEQFGIKAIVNFKELPAFKNISRKVYSYSSMNPRTKISAAALLWLEESARQQFTESYIASKKIEYSDIDAAANYLGYSDSISPMRMRMTDSYSRPIEEFMFHTLVTNSIYNLTSKLAAMGVKVKDQSYGRLVLPLEPSDGAGAREAYAYITKFETQLEDLGLYLKTQDAIKFKLDRYFKTKNESELFSGLEKFTDAELKRLAEGINKMVEENADLLKPYGGMILTFWPTGYRMSSEAAREKVLKDFDMDLLDKSFRLQPQVLGAAIKSALADVYNLKDLQRNVHPFVFKHVKEYVVTMSDEEIYETISRRYSYATMDKFLDACQFLGRTPSEKFISAKLEYFASQQFKDYEYFARVERDFKYKYTRIQVDTTVNAFIDLVGKNNGRKPSNAHYFYVFLAQVWDRISDDARQRLIAQIAMMNDGELFIKKIGVQKFKKEELNGFLSYFNASQVLVLINDSDPIKFKQNASMFKERIVELIEETKKMSAEEWTTSVWGKANSALQLAIAVDDDDFIKVSVQKLKESGPRLGAKYFVPFIQKLIEYTKYDVLSVQDQIDLCAIAEKRVVDGWGEPSERRELKTNMASLLASLAVKDKNKAQQVYSTLGNRIKKEFIVYMTSYGFVDDAMNEVMGDDAPIKPQMKLNHERLLDILEYNNVSLPGSDLRVNSPAAKTVDSLLAIKQDLAKKHKIDKLKVTEDVKGQAELDLMTIEYDAFNKYRHGDISVKFLRAFDVDLPVQKAGYEEWTKNHPNAEVISPAFHGTGSIGASMILRYGFAVIKSNDPSVVGRMLGDGIYFSTVLDKVAQYVGDSGYSRGIGNTGYIFEMDANLGEPNKDYRAAGLGTDSIRSPEWCVFTPNSQLRIKRAYLIEIISKQNMQELKKQYDMLTEASVTRIKRFDSFKRTSTVKNTNAISYVFMDGYIPVSKDKSVPFEEFEKLNLKNVRVDYSGSGPVVVISGQDTSDVLCVNFTSRFMRDQVELEKFLALIGK